ncbi:MAG: hypothetical protein JSV62_15900 [Promethearchaeota archaeon]|nr:MAG: hypothetical protein JSV62_15900 [Candidatus Lokiarchaeota archaeon]
MVAGSLNLIIEKGAVFYKRIKWLAPNRSLVSFHAYKSDLYIRNSRGELTIHLSTDNGRLEIEDEEELDGKFLRIKLSAIETEAIDFDGGNYTLVVTPLDELGEPATLLARRLLEGVVIIK